MVFDINNYKSHPNKLLLTHIDGVRNNVKLLTNSKLAELVAVFHDLGKINPNFQKKLLGESVGYSHHAYLSAYAFFCAFIASDKNRKKIKDFLGWNLISTNDIIGICVLIAKHHGNLPDFIPIDYNYIGKTILDRDENIDLFKFLDNNTLPIVEYIKQFLDLEDFSSFLNNERTKRCYLSQFVFNEERNIRPLDFFLDFQFAFASVIQADKADAADLDNYIESKQNDIYKFCKTFASKLEAYLTLLRQDSELNKVRTKMRVESVENLSKTLANHRVFELTAPTGSGKTLMLLSLASEIIKQKGAKRIIYGLPFLSITEQVENEVLKIFDGQEEYIQRIDSKSENRRFEELQDDLEYNPSEAKIEELNILEFQENTFAYPFIITTFVRFFETLLSNRNSELLKLPNFTNCIFLLDEIQSLPPRLYGFFVGYISRFCERFNSYAIISTATQPNYSLPEENANIKSIFRDYKKPKSLISLEYFNNEVFNRYKIEFNRDIIDLMKLKEKIIEENNSILVILNTIDDTKDLYSLLSTDFKDSELILLNTHFTPRDRNLKIYLAKRRLKEEKKIIVISTQLIEAGVDIDFPVLYRDFATVASIVQSAGRCNRNGKFATKGKVFLFKLSNKNKIRSELIYRGIDRDLLSRFTTNAFDKSTYEEKELLLVQRVFFNYIQNELHFAKHWKKGNNNLQNPDFDFIKDIKQCMYDKIGKFQLIDKQEYGEERQYFIPRKANDNRFELLLFKEEELMELFRRKESISKIKIKKREIESQLKKMANDIVQIRLKGNQQQPLLGSERSYFDLFKINKTFYSFKEGINLNGNEYIL